MPSPSSSRLKKRVKTKNKLPEKKIKPEPKISYPLSHYVDDRVELIRQTFSNLKSKAIKSMASGYIEVLI